MQRSDRKLGNWLVHLNPELKGRARAVCGSAEQAEDLTQDAIVRALEAKRRPRTQQELRPWLFRVIRNLHLDGLRKARVRTEYQTSLERLTKESKDSAAQPLDDLLVRQAFERLSPHHQEVLSLVDMMGMRYAEAAAALEVPEGTVMSRVSRARRALIEALDGSNVTPLPVRRAGGD